jgi:hypothetical protein
MDCQKVMHFEACQKWWYMDYVYNKKKQFKSILLTEENV